MAEHSSDEAAYEFTSEPARDVRTGYLTGPGVHELPVQYEVVDGIALFGGCIELGSVEEVEAEAARIRAADLAAADPAIGGEQATELELQGVGLPSTSSFLWPGGVVPYGIAANLPNAQRVTDAIAHIEARTPVRFVQRTAANAARYPNWVEFVPHASVNSSPVGMRGTGRQRINLTSGASMGVVVHECFHCLGVYHEHQRSDRDEFVEIRWRNIQQDKLHNFQLVPGSIDYYDYDYGSIMHYPRWAFQTGDEDTIVPRQDGVTIGQRTALSFGDRLTIAKMYERFFARGYTGVWRAQPGRYGLWANASWDSFRSKWSEWSGSGLRLVDIHTRLVAGQTRYSGVFLAGSGGHALWANSRWDSFRQKWLELGGQGLRLVGLHIHRVGGENRYTGAWLPGQGKYGLWVNASWDSFRAKWQELGTQGLRLVDVHVHNMNGAPRYSGVWLAGTGAYALWANASWDSFRAKWQELGGRGLRLVDVNVHTDGGANRYTGVWRAGTGGHALWANVTWESFRAKWEQLAAEGYRLVDFELPSPEVGAAGDAAVADLAVDGEVPADPALEDDGLGGIFGEDAAEVAPRAAPGVRDPMDVGAVVTDTADLAIELSVGDGQGGVVGDGADTLRAGGEEEEAVGGLDGLEGHATAARRGDGQEAAGGLVGAD